MPTQQPSSLSAFRYNYCPRARRQPFTRDRDPLSTYSGQGCPLRRIIQKTPKGFAKPDFLIHIHYSLFTIHYSLFRADTESRNRGAQLEYCPIIMLLCPYPTTWNARHAATHNATGRAGEGDSRGTITTLWCSSFLPHCEEALSTATVGVAGFRLGNGTTFLILMDKRVRHLKQTTLERLQNPTQDGLYSGVPMGRKSRKSKSNYSVPINV